MKLRALINSTLLVLTLEIVSTNVLSQNVGIGTTTPLEKLEIKNPSRSTVKISSNNYTDTSGLLFSNRNSLNQGTDFYLKSIQEEGLAFSSLSDLPANTFPNALIIKPNGNIGINTYNPSQRLEVTGNSVFHGFVGLGGTPSVRLEIAGAVKLQGTNAFEFGSGIAGKEINAGKLGYQVFTADALDIVGAGTNAANRKIKLWSEGGTSVSGSLGIAGALQVNGNPGTIGQVLTSNGSSAPQWKNTSFANNTRFSADIPSFTLGGTLTFNNIYNQDPSNITIGSTAITLNRGGLYHFEGYLNTETSFSGGTPTNFYVFLDFVVGATFYNISNYKQPERLIGYPSVFFTSMSRFEQDVYIVAGTTVTLSFGYGITLGSATVSGSSNKGKLTGYLISE